MPKIPEEFFSMVKFTEAHSRKIKNVFICKKCKSKVRAPSLKVSQEKIRCRKCKAKKLRPRRKK